MFLCQFGKIDLEGLVKSTTLPQFVLHSLFLMELVENLTDKVRQFYLSRNDANQVYIHFSHAGSFLVEVPNFLQLSACA